MLVWSYQHGAFMSKVLSSFSVAHNGLIIHICTRYLCIYTYTRINRHTLHTYTHSPYSFVFYIGVELINNVVLMSGVQQSDSVIHIYVSILFQILFPFRLFQKIERSSLCDTVDPCWLSILNIAVCTCQSQAPILSFPPPLLPTGNHNCHDLCGSFFVLFNQNPSSFMFPQHQLVLPTALSSGIKWI